MSALNKVQLENYIKLVDDNIANFRLIKSTFTTNVQNINQNLNNIIFSYWSDDIATSLNDYKTYLKSGVVAKLNNSLDDEGSFYYLEALLNDLKEKCQNCLNFINGVGDLYMGITLSSTGNSFDYNSGPFLSSPEYASTHYTGTSEEAATLNKELHSQFVAIDDTLLKIKNLKFDDVIDYEITINTPYELPEAPKHEFVEITEDDLQRKKNESLPVGEKLVINQYDKVRVLVKKSEDEEGSYLNMYYLGTDSKGRSYFSETTDPDALVYRAVLNNPVETSQTYLNDPEYLGDPLLGSGYASARASFVIFGGNTEDMTVHNILDYPNGAYTGDANFNTSLVYDNSTSAPEVVEVGNGSYDPNNAYHMVNYNSDNCTSLSAIYEKHSVDLNEHPTIMLQPGEKITTKYGGIFGIDFTKEKYTIGNDEIPTYLVWDDTKNAYYVIDSNGGYYTSSRYGDYGKGYRYVTIDSLKAGDTQVNIK